MKIGLGLWNSGGGLSYDPALVASLRSEMLIATRDGALTVTSDATVNSETGAAVPANTAWGRDLIIGGVAIPGAALSAYRASSSMMIAVSSTFGLTSNVAAAGERWPTERTIVENAAVNTGHFAFCAAVALTDGIDYCASVLVKRGVGTRNLLLDVDRSDVNTFGARFDLTAGTTVIQASVGNGVFVRSSIRSLGDGWYLCQVTGNSPAWGGNVRMRCRMVSGATATYTGDGVSSLILSGYKTEDGGYATPPHNWDGGVVSRVANRLSWAQSLDLAAGTVFAWGLPYGWAGLINTPTPRLYDATPSTGYLLYQGSGAGEYACIRTDALVAPNGTTSAAKPAIAGQQKIVTQRFDATSNRITVDGVTVSSAAPTLPFAAATPVIIGNRSALDRYFDGNVAIGILARAASDAEVAAIVASSYIK